MRDVILVLIGAIVAGAGRILLDQVDKKQKQRVAARVLLGDIVVAEEVFNLAIERKEWSPLTEFGPTLEAWREYRADFAGATTAVEWTQVGAFYSNLERSARMVRPGQFCSEADLRVAASMVEYSKHAYAVAAKHVAGTEKERKEVLDQAFERLDKEKDTA
jgi:hypothetical protein